MQASCTWDIVLAAMLGGLAGQWAPIPRWAEVTPLLNGLGRQCVLRGGQQHSPAPNRVWGVLASAHQPEVWEEAGLPRECGSMEPLCSAVRTLKLHSLFLQSFRKAQNVNQKPVLSSFSKVNIYLNS